VSEVSKPELLSSVVLLLVVLLPVVPSPVEPSPVEPSPVVLAPVVLLPVEPSSVVVPLVAVPLVVLLPVASPVTLDSPVDPSVAPVDDDESELDCPTVVSSLAELMVSELSPSTPQKHVPHELPSDRQDCLPRLPSGHSQSRCLPGTHSPIGVVVMFVVVGFPEVSSVPSPAGWHASTHASVDSNTTLNRGTAL